MAKPNSKDLPINQQDATRFWKLVNTQSESECWIWKGNKVTSPRGSAYGNFSLRQNRKQRLVLAHRYSFALHNKQPGEMFVLHTCDNPLCVNPKHLYLGNQNQNMADKVKRNRCSRLFGDKNPTRTRPDKVAKGEQVSLAKLNPEKVRKIRQLYAAGNINQVELAEMFGVIQITISCVIRRKTWKHVE